MSGWRTTEMPEQTDRRVVVTGANSGIGFHAARELAQHGAHVTLAVRDTEKGEEASRRIPGATEVRRLDLADLDSVRAFADTWDEPLDLLINNAGIMAPPYRTTAQGFESQLGTNHLGHFALTGLLLPWLGKTSAPRVVTVSSGAHRMGKIRFDDLQSEQGYKPWRAYGQSKLANLLFCFELQRRADNAGSPLISTAAHPGYAATNLQTGTSSRLQDLVMGVLNKVVAQSAEAGALPTLMAATADLPGAAYVGPAGPGEARGLPHLVGASDAATDAQTAARLWAVSEELTGVAFDFVAS
ncbi:MAG: SDR family NAD(P)-dependent oxidoreductase [Solirubrobacterales bacterium]|nr:SDR family NAD(P)-dependent oxidoreductase [Solirubrobacterales bacterium]